MDKINLSQEIVVLRGKMGCTQQELADAIGTTARTVAAWESGASIPRKAMKVRIAQAFGLPEDYFWDEEERNPTAKKTSDTEARGVQEPDKGTEMLKKLEQLMNETDNSITAEQKKLCLEACQSILRGK